MLCFLLGRCVLVRASGRTVGRRLVVGVVGLRALVGGPVFFYVPRVLSPKPFRVRFAEG